MSEEYASRLAPLASEDMVDGLPEVKVESKGESSVRST